MIRSLSHQPPTLTGGLAGTGSPPGREGGRKNSAQGGKAHAEHLLCARDCTKCFLHLPSLLRPSSMELNSVGLPLLQMRNRDNTA